LPQAQVRRRPPGAGDESLYNRAMPKKCPRKLNVLLVGKGGREHALARKLADSPRLGDFFVTDPGNPGIDALARPIDVPFDIKQAYRLQQFCDKHDIGLVVVGPEQPLADGWADVLATDTRLVLGPTKEGAQLEASKVWAKQLMRQAAIPTAESRILTTIDAAREYVRTRDEPMVIKASGLAAGKGVMICDTPEEGLEAVERLMGERAFGEAGDKIIVEEKLQGQEVSIFALVDGRNIWLLDSCQDHKQLLERDQGPNTGGMGAYSPTPIVDSALMQEIQRDIIVPTIDGLRREGIDYRGVLYAGLMLTPGGPKVLEYNVRFGDPECQVLMPRLDCDLVEVLWCTANGSLDQCDLGSESRTACCVVMASNGYPGSYEKGKPIAGIADAEALGDVTVYFAGVARQGGDYVTAGGRVLGVTALADSLADAQQLANSACEKIHFEDAHWRRDIGWRVMPALK
jgi:phosphoribosylamine--glycine ligase